MKKSIMPTYFLLHKSKEVIFYSKSPVLSDIEISEWMTNFPDGYKGMVMQNACLFKRLKEQAEE
tara:strand:- start:105 stop:296 length:192 start_codon:yes stop_codon:yes gene_type:complete